ncbi:ProQ/FINO family protein [Acinetobacter ursingii]|uniref:ProQ/FinO domain-containing protein n=1 Tax=Acinetobacter ursingii TaxID=108980 RepID=A0A3D2SLA5_9GAMM|nr:ProQ/FINO family protein [Acinetobacter ursingii]HCK29788.1 hypothetical protein [Acinetobacter ursingii]
MASNKSLAHSKAVLKMLMERYPHLFDYRKEYIFPLWIGITGEIIKDLQIHPDHHSSIKRAICYYQSWDGYLQSLAFSRVKYNLWKEQKQKTLALERNHAREELKRRKLWTERMEIVFIGKALQLD